MRVVNMLDAKSNLSKLVDAVESGAEREIVIARAGRPAVRIVPLAAKKPVRIGIADGRYKVPQTLEEFDAGNTEIAELFENSKIFPDDMLSEAEVGKILKDAVRRRGGK